MHEVFEFIKNNAVMLIVAGIVLAILILGILLIPKRFNKYWSALVAVLPNFIVDCENRGIVGSDKKLQYVKDLAFSFLASQTGLDLEVIKKRYGALIVNHIENILTAPQKKEN